MKTSSLTKLVTAAFLTLATSYILVGCGEKNVDPNAKVDAPGYYNGPLEGKGGAKGGEK